MITRTIKAGTMVRTIRSLQSMMTNQSGDYLPVDIIKYYDETKRYLLHYAQQVNSRFIREKTEKMESLRLEEFRRAPIAGYGVFGMMFGSMLRGARVNEKLEMKLEQLNNELDAIAQVIEDPELEKMYYNA